MITHALSCLERRCRYVPKGMLGIVLVFLVGVACVPSPVTITARKDIEQYHVQRLLVMPFTGLSTPQAGSSYRDESHVPEAVVRSDMSMATPTMGRSRMGRTATVPPQAVEYIAQLFVRTLRAHSGLFVLSPREVRPTLARERGNAASRSSFLVPSVISALDVDAALMGEVSVYRERVGSRYGAEPPAVGFQVHLVGGDGKILWTGNYYEEQRPLNEDLPSVFTRGIGFVTAKELADYGVTALLKEFPFGREAVPRSRVPQNAHRQDGAGRGTGQPDEHHSSD